uniref:Inositol-tetrakisphosphate 1-kinase a n=1 Tax=Callorhinchus milii TaxID=7868 RepID=A0A4W3GZX8_CALMI
MQTWLKGKRVGYWLSEKKIKKLNFQAFLDLVKPIEEQGPLDVIIHKLTDVILEADQNDAQSQELVQRFQDYIDTHPETIILDPLPAIRTLLDRCKSYELIRKLEGYMEDTRICSPPFMELSGQCGEDTMAQIEKHKLTFPFSKCPTRATSWGHCMAIIFSEDGLKDIKPQCVIQSFINHNAVLYKVFVIGESYTVVERPSLKNFSAGISERKSIFFNSHNVSKPESSSDLTALDVVEGVFALPSDDVIRKISRTLRNALGISLFGIDVIINNQTDINTQTWYEGVPEFFTELLNHIQVVLQARNPDPHQQQQQQQQQQLSQSRKGAEQDTVGRGEQRACSATSSYVNVAAKDAWLLEEDGKRLQHQRLTCNSAVPPNFQNCVPPMATKASSQ